MRNGRVSADAAERAAEANGFAAAWGGRQLRGWTRQWINDRKLPESMRGRHAKVATLLAIPSIATEFRAYLRSNKWSMNPEKLAKFTNNEMITKEADLYLKNVINDEMPNALKRYIKLELFPRIHLKVGCGISLSTACCWLHREGFRYMSHKKGLYFDGHDCPDVVEYRQNVFLPAMKEFEHRLVQYAIGDVEKELFVQPRNYVEHCLVPTPHDEMTAQSNDMNDKEWVFDNEFKLRKKGVGRGIHRSDVICSTCGHLSQAGESMEYGKNYEGYWNGERFCTQVGTKIVVGINFSPNTVTDGRENYSGIQSSSRSRLSGFIHHRQFPGAFCIC